MFESGCSAFEGLKHAADPLSTDMRAGIVDVLTFVSLGWLQSCCTERSTHTYARVPADLAQTPDGRGKVKGGSGEGFYLVLHGET